MYGLYTPSKLKGILLAIAAERSYHPIRDYLEALPEWDGVPRVETLFIDYLGSPDTLYIRAIARRMMVAAIARIYEPGVKFDSVVVLNGPQGMGKSSFFAKLGDKWFSDSLTISDMKDKAAPEKLQGYWILELGELAGLKKMDVETVKAFITRQDDKFRHSYGYSVEDHPRQCIAVLQESAVAADFPFLFHEFSHIIGIHISRIPMFILEPAADNRAVAAAECFFHGIRCHACAHDQRKTAYDIAKLTHLFDGRCLARFIASDNNGVTALLAQKQILPH